MRRRDSIKLLGGAAVAWPLTAFAQQVERVRLIGVLMSFSVDDPEALLRIASFTETLKRSGWTAGRTVRIEYRWGAGDADRYRRFAAELVALSPDVLVATNASTVRAFRRATRTIPIIFAGAVDPVGSGLVASLARPGGNVTGFTAFEFGMSGKWVELLGEIAPRVRRAMILRDATTTGGTGQYSAIQATASSMAIEVNPIDVDEPGEIARTIALFARVPNGGMIVASGAKVAAHRDLIFKLAADYRLPTVYPFRFWAIGGGLISYGPDRIDAWRLTAAYVDRVLKGEKPADLPVQAPTKYELVINLKTAKTLGLTVPDSLLARANEVIE